MNFLKARTLPPLQYAVFSHKGLVRKLNEDAWASTQAASIFCLGDGMGGMDMGGWASRHLCSSLADRLSCVNSLSPAVIEQQVHQVNMEIYRHLTMQGFRGGSTLVLLVFRGLDAICYWAGDSRLFLLRDGELHQKTVDHTTSALSGNLDGSSRVGNVASGVTCAIGVEPVIKGDLIRFRVRSGDRLFLCSDGVHGVLSPFAIERLLSLGCPVVSCQQLQKEILYLGAPDNFTGMVIDV